MTHEIVSVLCGGGGPWLSDGKPGLGVGARVFDNTDNKFSPCEAYQKLLERCTAEIIIYVHDDVSVFDPDWLSRVLAPFERPEVVAVGLGGATGLGNRDLYRKSYNIWNLARRGYASNQTDAEVHGERFTGERRVAVLDAFFMAIRTDFLRSVGGWPVDHLTHHACDLWLACEAAKASQETWMVGVKVLHSGGGTSTKPTYRKASWKLGGTLESDHIVPHKFIYENYRDVLPIEVGQE